MSQTLELIVHCSSYIDDKRCKSSETALSSVVKSDTTKANEPMYRGVIDDEEFTCYWYPTETSDWEILEDPTGMAYRTIYQKVDHVSKEEFEDVMNQLKTLKVEIQD